MRYAAGDSERVEAAEQIASWIVGVLLALLCVFVLLVALHGLVAQAKPERSVIGIAVALGAVVLMPWLGLRKHSLAGKLGSEALRGDAACSLTCAYMAATVLGGLLLNSLLGWWWADGVAALLLLFWLVPEAREVLDGARTGHAGCACGADGAGGEGDATKPSRVHPVQP